MRTDSSALTWTWTTWREGADSRPLTSTAMRLTPFWPLRPALTASESSRHTDTHTQNMNDSTAFQLDFTCDCKPSAALSASDIYIACFAMISTLTMRAGILETFTLFFTTIDMTSSYSKRYWNGVTRRADILFYVCFSTVTWGVSGQWSTDRPKGDSPGLIWGGCSTREKGVYGLYA